jgi:lipopolysaccharide export system protein LptA
MVMATALSPSKSTAKATTKTTNKIAPVKIAPTVPKANRMLPNRVFLERADILHKNTPDSFMVVSGNVEFSKGPMLMFCDSAQYFPASQSMNAFGNVRMEQGDTLFIYADELNYDGVEEKAYLYGEDRPVRMINRDVKLETNEFVYDMVQEVGYYENFGTLTDPKNKLTSMRGEYLPPTKDATFQDDVVLLSNNGRDTIETDILTYNTVTHVADFYQQTVIKNPKGRIYTSEGSYNTNNQVAELVSRSSVISSERGTTLEGDTLFYDRDKGYGVGFGRVSIVDPVRQSSLNGDYGFYNEVTDSAFVTGHAIAKEYSRGDTLYMHGKYLTSTRVFDTIQPKIPEQKAEVDSLSDSIVPRIDLKEELALQATVDTTHIVKAWPRVRFYRSDIQGLCDSMTFVERDSMLYMHRHPIVWSDDREIFGNQIVLHLNDSTVDRAVLPDFGFSAQHIETDFYNQLTGRKMEAWFENAKLRQLDVSGSVEAILFPEENDSTINKMIYTQSAFMHATFLKDNVERIKTWPETSGQVTPLYLAKRSQLLLSKFSWHDGLRPEGPEDITVIPKEMDELMGNTEIPELPRFYPHDVLPGIPEEEQTDSSTEKTKDKKAAAEPEPAAEPDAESPQEPAAEESQTLEVPLTPESPQQNNEN